MDDLTNDIATALLRLRAAFAKHDIPCPDVLEYSDPAKAYQAIPQLKMAGVAGYTSWAMDYKAGAYGEMSVAGFTFRFEARGMERPGTGMELDDGFSGRVWQRDL